ncbi:hypothetical protein HDE70_001271 [Pedobacter cryoconitis]|nr:hypothetical protein [Pedobacter cryoconitis]
MIKSLTVKQLTRILGVEDFTNNSSIPLLRLTEKVKITKKNKNI